MNLNFGIKAIVAIVMSMALQVQAQNKVTITHNLGSTEVTENPSKVVIYDIGSLETYHELGIPVYGMLNNVPAYLPEYQAEKYKKLGGIKEPDLEALKAVAPDLIVISGRQSSFYEELSKIAPTVFLGVDTENYWESFKDNVNTIAKLHGKQELAAEKLNQLEAKRNKVLEVSKADSKKGIVMLQVRGNYSAYGEGARFGFPYDVLGIKIADNIENTGGHTGFSVTEGYMKKINPDYILLIDRDSAVGGEVKSINELLNDEMKSTKAYKNNGAVQLTGNIWYTSGGGLISVDRMITEIGNKVYNLNL